MKLNFCFLIFVFVIFSSGIIMFSFVSSQDEAKYNFGSMQADKSFSLKPGQEVSTKLYFYNLYGNRATHIKLNVAEKPANWQVSIIPEISKKEYEVSGIKINIDENLVVYPSNVSEIQGENTETTEYINSKVGWIKADFLVISIKIPENEKIGLTKNIKINAVASWLGQAGSIALQQERDFEYSLTTTTEYYEKPAGDNGAASKLTGIFQQSKIKPVYMLLVGITLILIIVFILLVFAGKKTRKRKIR